jgi:hypothetical protein
VLRDKAAKKKKKNNNAHILPQRAAEAVATEPRSYSTTTTPSSSQSSQSPSSSSSLSIPPPSLGAFAALPTSEQVTLLADKPVSHFSLNPFLDYQEVVARRLLASDDDDATSSKGQLGGEGPGAGGAGALNLQLQLQLEAMDGADCVAQLPTPQAKAVVLEKVNLDKCVRLLVELKLRGKGFNDDVLACMGKGAQAAVRATAEANCKQAASAAFKKKKKNKKKKNNAGRSSSSGSFVSGSEEEVADEMGALLLECGDASAVAAAAVGLPTASASALLLEILRRVRGGKENNTGCKEEEKESLYQRKIGRCREAHSLICNFRFTIAPSLINNAPPPSPPIACFFSLSFFNPFFNGFRAGPLWWVRSFWPCPVAQGALSWLVPQPQL